MYASDLVIVILDGGAEITGVETDKNATATLYSQCWPGDSNPARDVGAKRGWPKTHLHRES